MSDILSSLKEFDGIAVSLLSEARAKFRSHPDYFTKLIELCRIKSGKIADGATWMLNAEVEEGWEPSPTQVADIVSVLPDLLSWQAILHLCQIADRLDLTQTQAEQFFDWAIALTDHRRPFVRAWSMHACVKLGLAHIPLHKKGMAILEAGENDPAGSVKARARNLRKDMGMG